MSESKLTLVIPLFNEQESIPFVIPEILEFCKDVYNIVIVNDGSTDNSKKLLQEYTKQITDCTNVVSIIDHDFNKGYGAAIKSGIKKAHTEYVVTLDADGQHVLDDVSRMLDYISENKTDLLIGSRNNIGGSYTRRFGKWIIRSLTKLMIRLDIQDLNSGLKMYKREEIVKILDHCPDGMSFSDSIVIVSLINEYRVSEICININPRESGKSKVNLNVFFETIMSIIMIIILNNPLRFFIPVSIILFMLGVTWGGYFIAINQGVSVATSLLLMLSAITFTTGLISQQISQIWRYIIKSNQKT